MADVCVQKYGNRTPPRPHCDSDMNWILNFSLNYAVKEQSGIGIIHERKVATQETHSVMVTRTTRELNGSLEYECIHVNRHFLIFNFLSRCKTTLPPRT